ncbi:MAG: FAD-dependent oxidoreductase [Bacilli bacterium]
MDKHNWKICIIGGGPAGLAAAMYLEQKGYNNYEILEKEDHVGGKCFSPTYKGKRYETGAIMGCDSYYAIHDMELFGGAIHDGPKLNREYKRADGKRYDPFSVKKFWQIPHLLKLKKQLGKLKELLETKYVGYDVNGHRGVSEGKYDGYSPATSERLHVSGKNPNLKDLALPFRDFLRLNNIPLVEEVWVGPYTSFGYGYFDEIPAAYVLKYLDFHTAMEFVNIRLWTWNEGTQSIFEKVNVKLKNPATLNANITKVERKNDQVIVTVNNEQKTYDKVIVTSPLQFLPDYFDATDEEKELFSKIDYERYDVLATTIQKGHYPKISCYIFDNMKLERIGRLMVFYHRWKDEEDQIITTYTLRKHRNQPEIPYDTAKNNVLEDMKTADTPVDKIVAEYKWYYFPHVFTEDYKAGWYEKVEAMQSKKNTFYAGEIMSFGDMEETCEYSRELVERFF